VVLDTHVEKRPDENRNAPELKNLFCAKSQTSHSDHQRGDRVVLDPLIEMITCFTRCSKNPTLKNRCQRILIRRVRSGHGWKSLEFRACGHQ
jgi:hypothetical protein